MSMGPAPDPLSLFLNGTVIAAALTGAVTAAGWFVSKTIDARQQARLKRAEFRRSYIQKQIEEFYGPLYSLAWQIITTNYLKGRMLGHPDLPEKDRSTIEDFLATRYFLPTHNRILSILKTKLYLLDGTTMPNSFYNYLAHAIQETVQHELWSERGVSTIFIPGSPYPKEFQQTILASLQKLMKEYEVNVRELKGAKQTEAPRKDPRFEEAR